MSIAKPGFNHLEEWMTAKFDNAGLTVEEAAEMIGVSKATLYAYFKDKQRPSLQSITAICNLFHCSLEEGLAQYTPLDVGRPKKS